MNISELENNLVLDLLRFSPILKEKIWGGDYLGKNFSKKTNYTNIGESWELSGVSGNESVVSNGIHKGETITNLLKKYKGDLVGKKVYDVFQNDFPLLFKFIEARQNLSIQLHLFMRELYDSYSIKKVV